MFHKITRRQFLGAATLLSALDSSPSLHAEALEGAPDPFLRTPTLHNMKPDSVSILWTLPSIVAGSVLITAPDGSTTQFDASLQTFSSASTSLPATYYQYQADVTGLTPGVTYSYEVAASGKPLPHSALRRALRFRTPASSDSSFHFLCFGDSGDGGDYQLSLARQMMLEEDVSLVLANGDLAYDLATFASVETFYFGVYKEMMAGIPFFASLGNHEYYTDYGKPSLVSRVSPNPPQTIAQADQGRYYSFDWGNAHFVALDSNAPLEEAVAGRGAMLRWLERDLQETRKFWRIVFFHHPGYATGKHQDEPEAARVRSFIVPILEKYGVQLVFNGHEHTYQRTRELLGGQVVPANSGGIVYVTSGGGGATPYRVDPNNLTAVSLGENHYMRADVSGSTLVLHAKGLNQQDDLDTITLAPPPLVTGDVVVNGNTASIYGRNLCPVDFVPSSDAALAGCAVTLESAPVTILAANGNMIRIRIPDAFTGVGAIEVTTPNGVAKVQVTVNPATVGAA